MEGAGQVDSLTTGGRHAVSSQQAGEQERSATASAGISEQKAENREQNYEQRGMGSKWRQRIKGPSPRVQEVMAARRPIGIQMSRRRRPRYRDPFPPCSRMALGIILVQWVPSDDDGKVPLRASHTRHK